MNYIKKIIVITVLCVILIYVTNISAIPSKIIIFKNEKLELGEVIGVKIKEKKNTVIQTSNMNNAVEEKTITLSLFNVLDIKDVQVCVIENTKVIPLGNIIGVKIYSDGVLVIGMSEIEGKKPYENADIQEGDLITAVDNINITSTEELIECVNNSEGNKINLKYIRDDKEYSTVIEPVKNSKDEYKIGLWVRDGAVRNRYSNIL